MLCPACYALVPLRSDACARCGRRLDQPAAPEESAAPDSGTGHDGQALSSEARAAILEGTLARMSLQGWHVVRRQDARAELRRAGRARLLYIEIQPDGSVDRQEAPPERHGATAPVRRPLRLLARLIRRVRGGGSAPDRRGPYE